MARTQPFKMRLTDDEVSDLEARARRDGIAKADVIRRAMGWAIVGLKKPSSDAGDRHDTSRPLGLPPRPASPSPSNEPGVAAAGELARRIAERRKQ